MVKKQNWNVKIDRKKLEKARELMLKKKPELCTNDYQVGNKGHDFWFDIIIEYLERLE